MGKCTRDDFRYHYHFLNFVDDCPYFCYFGCEEKYRTPSALEDHLIECHSEDDLRQWGISAKHILKKRNIDKSRKSVGDPSGSDSENQPVKHLPQSEQADDEQ